jgi:hypothetical protein
VALTTTTERESMPFSIPDPKNRLQYHFVVMYDCETGEFQLDYETQGAVFSDGPVFDKDTQEWRLLEDDEWEEDGTPYNTAGDALFDTLESDLNKRIF